MSRVSAELLNVVLNHTLATAIVFFVLGAVVVGSQPGRIGGVVGAVGVYLLLTKVDDDLLLRAGAWAVRNFTTVAVVTVVALLVSLVLTRWPAPPGGDLTRGVAGVVFGVSLVPLVMFGLAAGTGHELLRAETSVPEITGIDGAYVALGDSYSSGEGLAPYFDSSGADQNNCHQSSRGYPSLLAEQSDLDFRYRACSGARTADLVHPRLANGYDDVPAQVDGGELGDGPLDGDAGLVTITIGGNDLHFDDVLVHCFVEADCLDAPFRLPRPDLNDEGMPGSAPLGTWLQEGIRVVGLRLEQVLGDVRARAPHARIVVVGYPRLLPVGGLPLQFTDCDVVLRRISGAEREGLALLQDRLNERIHQAAAEAGVEYVDPGAAFEGHEACGARGGMINAARLSGDGLDRAAFHPTAAGQRALARLVACYLIDFPEPRGQFQRAVDGSRELAPAAGSAEAPLDCKGP